MQSGRHHTRSSPCPDDSPPLRQHPAGAELPHLPAHLPGGTTGESLKQPETVAPCLQVRRSDLLASPRRCRDAPVTWPCPELLSQGTAAGMPPFTSASCCGAQSAALLALRVPGDPCGWPGVGQGGWAAAVGAGTRCRRARAGSAARRVESRSAHRGPSPHMPRARAPCAGGSPSAPLHLLLPAGIRGETAPPLCSASPCSRTAVGPPSCTLGPAVPWALPAAACNPCSQAWAGSHLIHHASEAGNLSAPTKRQEFPIRSGVCWAGWGISRACTPYRAVSTGEKRHWPHTEVLGELCGIRSPCFHPFPHPHPWGQARLILRSLVLAVGGGQRARSEGEQLMPQSVEKPDS